ncbi:unnamed protein product [Spirodela intermedia]|uniref:UDENN domain-containing protein n=1 Tax=Spirodela intermedia TaxID=51605 RepID=A0A7I8J7V1_SPIIN|nr:unnamed protein product [Spirodela intermedia]CAA6666159.1 unnamed protein product [Spirodela intermedia]
MSSRIFEYFVVCGIGPEIQTLDGEKGYHGTGYKYAVSLLDQFPATDHSLYPPPPHHSLYPQLHPRSCQRCALLSYHSLSRCVLPAGIEFYDSGIDSNDVSTYGSKIYVSCIAFRDPVCKDICEAYGIPANSFADKCICLVSRHPSFSVLRMYWKNCLISAFLPLEAGYLAVVDIIAHMVSNVPLPTPGKDRVLFAIDNCLLSVEAPPKEGLPHADISFQHLMQCLDVDNLIKLFTAVLLERRILLRSNKYALLTLVSEAICHLIYPFRWQHVYIPLLFFKGVEYIDAPTPYMMGLHSGVDTFGLTMDGVVIVDLEYNQITITEEIPPVPEPELGFLRGEITRLLHPKIVQIDQLKKSSGNVFDLLIFLKFFASLLSGYRNFIENSATHVFNSQAFLKKRARSTNQPPESMTMISQFLDSQGFSDYVERVATSDGNFNLLHKLQDAIGRGQSPAAILPSQGELEIITISDPEVGSEGSGAKYCYDRFPSNIRTEEQEEERRVILATASGNIDHSGKYAPSLPSLAVGLDPRAESLSPRERAAERERMVLDIKVKLQGLWVRLLKLGATEDPLSSFEYGTILALIESDAEGIGGSGFVECIREHIHSGWQCRLTEEQFIAVRELLKTAISRAASRNDWATIRDALEVSAEMYKKDSNNVPDYVQRQLISLSIWDDSRFWEAYFENLMECSSSKSVNYVILVTTQLFIVASHMAGLGIPDNDAWNIKLRGLLSHIQQLRIGYWGFSAGKVQSILSYGLPSPRPQDATDESQQTTEASGVGRSWVQSMFSRDAASRINSLSRAQLPSPVQKKIQSSVRILKGHSGAITALHCVTRREVWDLVGDREDAGFFISGSTDCTVKIWDPSLRGAELRTTLKGHTRPIRAISSDRGRIVSGSDDHSVIVWDKHVFQPLEELKGHDAPVSCVRMLSGERVLTASHDGTVKMWDVRTDTCVATVGRGLSAILCMEYDDSTGILAVAGRDTVANIWDIRAGRQMHKLQGHTKWIRSIRMVGDTVLTGSDDWTARVWSISRGSCDAVLACHAGPILCVEHSPADKGIITGSIDGILRFWENEEGRIKCTKNVTIHSASILSINAGEHWLGIGASDNSMSLFHRPQERLGSFSSTGSKMAGWQLYRTPQKLWQKRICSGGRNGLLRLWEATINI